MATHLFTILLQVLHGSNHRVNVILVGSLEVRGPLDRHFGFVFRGM